MKIALLPVSEYGKSRAVMVSARKPLQYVPALRSVNVTRGVSRIVELELGGLA